MKNGNDQIIVKAKVRFRTTAEGGRLTGVKTGYRPNHVFEIGKDGRFVQTYIGEIQFDEPVIIQLGDTHNITVTFLRLWNVERFIEIGRNWLIYEGSKLVAEAEIIEI